MIPITRSKIGTFILPNGEKTPNRFVVAPLETEVGKYKLDEDGLYRGKDFDALVAGTFWPGNWPVEVTFTEAELEAYLENTQLAIEKNVDEDGNVIGLPIDAGGHSHNEAAGWIVGASLETNDDGRKVLRFSAKWNEAGVELIASNQFRWFSGDIDTVNKVVLGGTLTNWPAIKAEDGGNLLRPVQLENGRQTIQAGTDEDESVTQFVRKIIEAFQAHDPFAWVLEVFDDHIIVDVEASLFSIDYQMVEETPVFVEKKNWVGVKQVFVEAENTDDKPGFLARITENIKKRKAASDKPAATKDPLPIVPPIEEVIPDGGLPMELTKEQLLQAYETILSRDEGESDEDYLVRFEAFKESGASGGAPLFAAGLKDVSEKNAEIVQAEVARLQAKQVRDIESAIARMEHEEKIAQFATVVTTAGLADYRGGLPVDPEFLRSLMLTLNPAQLPQFMTIIEAVVKNGLVSFEEVGHGKKKTGHVQLSDPIKANLREWLKGKDNDINGFFAINADIFGEMAEYDLSEFEAEA